MHRFAPQLFLKEKTKKNDQKAEKKGKKKAHFSGLRSSFVKVFDNKKFDSMNEVMNGRQIFDYEKNSVKGDDQNYYCKTRRA